MSGLDLRIVVPSRKRAHNMATIQWLLPSALICVDEREADDYLQAVPRSKLLLHPPMDGLPRVINWMQRAVDAAILVEVDDDFQGVQCNVGAKRYITDAEDILAIIENGARCASDLGLSAFCWSRTANVTIIDPVHRPIVPTQSVCNAFGILGPARHREYDPSLLGRADVDWTMRTLHQDRCVFADVRFYFDCGRVFGGRGGNVGLVTPEGFKEVSLAIKRRWGRYVSFRAPAFQKNRNVAAIRLNVSRTNKTAQK